MAPDSGGEPTVALPKPGGEPTVAFPKPEVEDTEKLHVADVGPTAAPNAVRQPEDSEQGRTQDAPPEDSAAGKEPRSLRRKLLILLAVVIAVLLVGAGIVWAVIHTATTNRTDAIKHTATAYLEAIARADAQGALSTLAEKPANLTLLTNEVLTASRSVAPLTDIAVTNPASEGGSDATVAVSYRLGDQPVSATLHLTGDGRTQWLIADGTADLKLENTTGLLINSVAVTQPTNPVFPGAYTVSTGTDNISLEGTASAVVADPDAAATLTVTPSLTEAGKQHIHNALKARLDECLASNESQPANCPFGVAKGDVEIAPGSVKFALVNNPWANAAPTLDMAKRSATGQISYVINATATVTRGGLTTDSTQRLERTVHYSVDLSKEPMPVTWSAA